MSLDADRTSQAWEKAMGNQGRGPAFPELNIIYSQRREKPKPTTAALQRGATAMQAGLTPLTFTVGPWPFPGLLAHRRPWVRHPKSGTKGHHCGWAHAPHDEPAAPDACHLRPPKQPRSYRPRLLQDAEGQSEGLAFGGICRELLSQMTQFNHEFPLAFT